MGGGDPNKADDGPALLCTEKNDASQGENTPNLRELTPKRATSLALTPCTSRETFLTDSASNSYSTRRLSSTFKSPNKSPRKRSHNKNQRTRVLFSKDELEIRNYPFASFQHSWKDRSGKTRTIVLPSETCKRMKDHFTMPSTSFGEFTRAYCMRKLEELDKLEFPFTISPMFYETCKATCGVTHELFADAINHSGVLENFCSLDHQDAFFCSKGRWEDVEHKVAGPAGVPPFKSDVVLKVIEKAEQGVQQVAPYCRIYVLPFNEGGVLKKKCKEPGFRGNIIALFEPDSLNFRHQKEFLTEDVGDKAQDWRPKFRIAVVVWRNEDYRLSWPVPVDVDECLSLWAIHAVGDESVLDFAAVWRAFPERCRNGGESAYLFDL